MMNDDNYEALLNGIQVGDDLVVKASLRVNAQPMKHALLESLSSDLVSVYRDRMDVLLEAIAQVLAEPEEVEQPANQIMLLPDGNLIMKAATPPQAPRNPRQASASPRERERTPDGYYHVENAGSRGGKFWRDDRGNVRYGERPHGNFQVAASPEQVVEHYRKYYEPQPFQTHLHSDIHEALMESSVMSTTDKAFMEWWHEAYDDILEGLGTNRAEVEKAGGMKNQTFVIGGRPMHVGQAIEEFFKAQVDSFVGDPVYGEIESADDIVTAIRDLMDRYRKALHEDPKVQALAQAKAEKFEAEKNAFYLNAEHQEEAFSPLSNDLMTVQDPADLAVRFTVALQQLGLLERGKGGNVAQTRMRGAIQLKSAFLAQAKRKLGSLWKEDAQLDRMSASQLMALHMATELHDSFSADNTYEYEPDAKNKGRDKVFGLILDKLGMEHDEAGAAVVKRQLQKATEAMAKSWTDYNTGQDPHFDKVLKMKVNDVTGDSEGLQAHLEDVAKEQARIEKILAAQEDVTFEVPESMRDGVWNGTTLKDPNDPSKGVWSPFEYQKKYINWMKAVKRGVLAADAGLGKTPMVIAFREMLAAEGKDVPAICFLPPSLMEQWPSAVAKFAPGNADKVLNLSGLSLDERKAVLKNEMKKAPDKRARYIFISTGTLTGEVGDPNADDSENDGTGGSDHEMVNILKGLEGAVFIDEAHSGGYKKAGNTRHEIAKAVMEGREYAFGMTATPMPNDPMDLYHLSNLFAPGSVGDQELWMGRMAGVTENKETGGYDVSNPEHLADLNKRLKPFVFYKSVGDDDVQKDMQKGLPERQGVSPNQSDWDSEGDLSLSKHVTSANGLSQHDYFKKDGVIDTMVTLRMQRLVSERQAKVESGAMDPKTGEPYEPYHPAMLQLMAGGMQIMLQRQAAISPALIDPSYRKHDGGVAHAPKLNAICDDIVTHFANGGQGGDNAKPLVVFCSFPGKAYPMLRQALAERGVDPSLIETISGEVAPSERGYMQDKLNKGHTKVLLVGTMSGGAGLNLQEAANKTLFLDEPWNPAAKRQAIGRVWRTGQNADVVHEKTYRMRDTFDMTVEQKIAGKQAMQHALLGKELPTSDTFDTTDSIKDLLGRVKGADFNEKQIRAIMEGAREYDLGSNEHKLAELIVNEHWQSAASEGGQGGVGATLTDEHFKPSDEGQQKLKNKGAHSLTKQFDEKEFRGEWELNREARMTQQNIDTATLMHRIHTEDGNKEKAEEYKRKLDRIMGDAKENHKKVTERAAHYRSKGDEKTAKIWDNHAKQLSKHAGTDEKAKAESGGESSKHKNADGSTTTTTKTKNKHGGFDTKETTDPGEPDQTKDVLSQLDAMARGKGSSADKNLKGEAKGSDAAEKPKRATATVREAEAKNKPALGEVKEKKDPPKGTTRPQKQSGEAENEAKPSEAPRTKPVKSDKNLGVDFHTKDNPFKDGSSKKVKGHDITQGEAHVVFNLLSKNKHASWDDFVQNEIEPYWEDEGGTNKYTPKKALAYVQKIVDAIQSHGALSVQPPSRQPSDAAPGKAYTKKELADRAKAEKKEEREQNKGPKTRPTKYGAAGDWRENKKQEDEYKKRTKEQK